MAVSAELGERREVALSAGTIRYRERGSGQPILFLHGALVNADLWHAVVPHLAAEHRCIAPDWPFGAHEVPMRADADLTPPGIAALVDEFMGALGVEDTTVVANDTGGAIAQILVTQRPRRVGRLVLTSCDAFANFPPHSLKPLQPLGWAPGGGKLLARSLRPRSARRALVRLLAKRPVSDTVIDSCLGQIDRDPDVARDFLRFFRALRPRHTLEAARHLPEFDRPALVAWSADDLFFPVAHGQRLAGLIPLARFATIEDSRTFSALDRPDRLTELIAGLLSDEAAGAPVSR